AFGDAQSFEARQAALDQSVGDALTPILRKHQQVLQVTATPVVARHDAAAEARFAFSHEFRHEAKARVTLQIAGGRIAGIGIAQRDAGGVAHEGDDGIVVVHRHDTDVDHGETCRQSGRAG
nr:hypothetical protein [Tanacetum cinerariifolium]